MPNVISFKANGVARPLSFPDELQIEYHEVDRITGKPTGISYLTGPSTLEQMWLNYRPVYPNDRAGIEIILARGERANLGEVEVQDMVIGDEEKR